MADRPLDVQRITELLLGGQLELTREQAASEAGLTVEQARPYWRAMGFADVGDRVAFARSDVEALRTLAGLVDSGFLTPDQAVEVVRSLGQTTSRLADWQVGTLGAAVAEGARGADLDEVATTVETVLPQLQSLLVHAWRRHLAAVVERRLAVAVEEEQAPEVPATVGFADVAGFTRLARVLGEEELAGLVQSFETGAADLVASHGARLVKTLGDEVMFVAPEPAIAVAVACALHELEMPADVARKLRIGLATGRLVSVMGDYYGDTVNRASRLTAVAKPGGTLVDPATEEALAGSAEFVVRHRRPRTLPGMGRVRASSVVRAAPARA